MQKAKLDILENIPDLEIPLSANETKGDEQSQTGPEVKWAFTKLLLIIVPTVLLALIVGGTLIYFLSGKPSSDIQTPMTLQPDEVVVREPLPGDPVHRPKPDAASESERFVQINDFIIDVQDSAGKTRVLMCDVVLHMEENYDRFDLEKDADVRKVIYRVVQTRSAVALKTVEERKKIKTAVAEELRKILGEGSVKKVYFTNYFIM